MDSPRCVYLDTYITINKRGQGTGGVRGERGINDDVNTVFMYEIPKNKI